MAEFLTGLLQALGSRFARVARLEAENLLLPSALLGAPILTRPFFFQLTCWSKLPGARNDGQC